MQKYNFFFNLNYFVYYYKFKQLQFNRLTIKAFEEYYKNCSSI